MLAVVVVGLAINLGGMWLLHQGSAESLNVKGAYFEVMSDAPGSLGGLVAAVVVLLTGWRLADPIVAAGIGLFIIPRTWALLRQAVDVLLEGTPAHLNLERGGGGMRSAPGVRWVHDLHAWTLTSGRYAMSAHVVVDTHRQSDRVLEELHALLHTRFGIDHTTIQLESQSLVQITPRTRRGDPESAS